MNNLNLIELYKWCGFWVFDDPNVGLYKEALVEGTDAIIDMAVANIPDAENGVMCMFSKNPFPGYQLTMELKTRGDNVVGNWYHCPQMGGDGWLCPALYKYFDVEPDTIYIKISPKS